jgi:hypothetical protein
MWLAVSRPKKDRGAEAREFSFQELAASAGKQSASFTAPDCLIDTGACVNSILVESPRSNPANCYPLLAKAFPGLKFFIIQVVSSGASWSCASFEAKNGRMRQTGVWKDEYPETREARRAWLGALVGHWLLDWPVFEGGPDPTLPLPPETAEGDHGLVRMEKQTVRACLEALRADGDALAYVRRQTPGICLAAVANKGTALRFVKNQSPKICLAAVKQDGCALEYVREKTRDICLAAVKQNYLAYRYVQETSPAIYRRFMKGFQEELDRIAAVHQTAM